MIKFLKRILIPLERRGKQRLAWLSWLLAGRPVPPPSLAKQQALKAYARRFKLSTLVETGTYQGDTVDGLKSHFKKIYSIELGQQLFLSAQNRFASNPHIKIFQGNSSQVLPQVLAMTDGPCLFWLDAHYSGGITAMADTDTPITGELRVILGSSPLGHVLLIDDARLFRGACGYPTLDRLKDMLKELRPGWVFEVKDDIIRFHPDHADI
jgi:hypothetical protein